MIGPAIKVISWWDRRSRSYITQALDTDDNQIDNAEFSGTKSERDLAEKMLKEEHQIGWNK